MGHRWDVMGRHIAVKGTTGMLTGAAIGSVGAGVGAIPGAGVGAALGMFRGALSGAAQLAHEQFLTKMANHSADHIRKTGKASRSLGVPRNAGVVHKAVVSAVNAVPRKPVVHSHSVNAVNTLGKAHTVAQALSANKAKAHTMANAVKNAQFESKHHRVHGRFQ